MQHAVVPTKTGIQLWAETFGSETHPAVLLISGAGSQCKFWADVFCTDLADRGYFVIRYDHRDTGKSSAVNYAEQPYTVMDLTQDAVSVLEHYGIPAAHIVGFSMGGQIAQFLGAYFPQYAKTLTLMGTSTSFEEGFSAFQGDWSDARLSKPKKDYVALATTPVAYDQLTLEEKIQNYMHAKQLLNGNKIPLDTEICLAIAKEYFTRSTLDNPYPSHSAAMLASYEPHRKAAPLINAPTLIIHGTEDPIFGLDHGDALKQAIKGSELVILEGMGHSLNAHFFDECIALIDLHAATK